MFVKLYMIRISCILAFLTVLAIISGCKKDDPPVRPPVTTVELRVFNATPWVFYDCTIDPAGTLSDQPGPGAYNFGQLDVNAKTGYQTFPRLYRYSWTRVNMNGKTYYLKPYDYTGETLLGSGRYTYKLTYTAAGDQLELELIKE